MTDITLCVPYIDDLEKLDLVIRTAEKHATPEIVDLLLIDNGSDKPYWPMPPPAHNWRNTHHIRFEKNIGVLPTYKVAAEVVETDITAFIHSDVLIHEEGWDKMVVAAFEADPHLGLAGFFGARGIGENGGRIESMSNMLGKTWGGCECHPVAAEHHGNVIHTVEAAAVLDGLSMIFATSVLRKLVAETDAFAEWRAPHHANDKILSMKALDMGYHVSVIPAAFDHYSGLTSNHSPKYTEFANQWLEAHGLSPEGDEGIYKLAHQQMFNEFQHRWPLMVNEGHGRMWFHGNRT